MPIYPGVTGNVVFLSRTQLKLFKRGEQGTMLTEVNVMKRLIGDPRALSLHDALEDSESLYLILELCPGRDVLGNAYEFHERISIMHPSHLPSVAIESERCRLHLSPDTDNNATCCGGQIPFWPTSRVKGRSPRRMRLPSCV